jgi:hypothetical protein
LAFIEAANSFDAIHWAQIVHQLRAYAGELLFTALSSAIQPCPMS